MRRNLSFIIIAAFLLISQYGMSQPRAVDLGLSVKWADCNLGANSPEEYGDYYAWGETATKTDYSLSTYKWFNDYNDVITRYCTDGGYGAVDNKTVLFPDDDVAHVKLGGKWRMPTAAEWDELIEECKWTWTTRGGKNGYKVTSKYNGNSIFLPAAGSLSDTRISGVGSHGYYWSSSLDADYPIGAWQFGFCSGSVGRDYCFRLFGNSIRPVTE